MLKYLLGFMHEFSVELWDGMGNNPGVRTPWSIDLSICGSLSLWCFFSPSPWSRGGELVSGAVCAVSEITCMQVLFVPISLVLLLGNPSQDNFCLCWCVQRERRAGKFTLPSASWKYFLSPKLEVKLEVFSKRNRCCTGESAFCAKGQVLDLFSSWHARTYWHSSHL